MTYQVDQRIVKKWAPMLDDPNEPKFRDRWTRDQTAQLMENLDIANRVSAAQTRMMLLGEAGPTNSMGASSSDPSTGNIDIYDPVMMTMLRRSMPALISPDIMGQQAMTGPSGIIFALRSHYDSQTGSEMFYNEPDTGKTARGGANVQSNTTTTGLASNTSIGGAIGNIGTVPGVSNNAANNTYNFAGGLTTQWAEGLGSGSNQLWPEMAVSVEKATVMAKERAMKVEYSTELAQDMMAVHNINTENLFDDLLQAELVADINREMVRTVNIAAKTGSQQSEIHTPGIFNLDVDASGRWSVEKFKGLLFQIDREANQIGIETRRRRGNVIIVSADVASALEASGKLDIAGDISSDLAAPDVNGPSVLGILNKRYKIVLDPYAGGNYFTIGFKGPNPMDAGLFYCPYVPLQKVRAIDSNTMQPKIGYKTRYGMVANPFAEGLNTNNGVINADANVYYRRTIVQSIL